jgi:2-polyprenyl-3-methyl-5-hydroxy-6-metoxy-1,4-benzoquinol methylase
LQSVDLDQPVGAQYFTANRDAMSAFLPAHYERTLEIGCASGGFASNLTKAAETWGVEPHAPAAARAAKTMTRVLTGIYGEVVDQLPNHYFDLVICNDVIEHMPDHDAFLRDIRSKVRPGAYLVGSLPNIRHITALVKLLFLRDWPYSDSGILDRTHLRFFTEKSMRRTFADHGMAIECLVGINSVVCSGVVGEVSQVKNLLYRLAAAGFVLASLGTAWDSQYPQYAFRVRF